MPSDGDMFKYTVSAFLPPKNSTKTWKCIITRVLACPFDIYRQLFLACEWYFSLLFNAQQRKIFDSNANDQCIPIRAAGVSTEESDFLMFPHSFSAEFQLSQLAAEETGVTFAYFSSVVQHFNTDVLTFSSVTFCYRPHPPSVLCLVQTAL